MVLDLCASKAGVPLVENIVFFVQWRFEGRDGNKICKWDRGTELRSFIPFIILKGPSNTLPRFVLGA